MKYRWYKSVRVELAIQINLGAFSSALLRPRVFSRASGCEPRRRPAGMFRRTFGSPGRAPWRVRVVGVQSRASWVYFKGMCSASHEPRRAGQDGGKSTQLPPSQQQ